MFTKYSFSLERQRKKFADYDGNISIRETMSKNYLSSSLKDWFTSKKFTKYTSNTPDIHRSSIICGT